ncbi:hypothetical protein DFA_11178 [Cavenderia fasciculata]|uniref:Uncharacterized protein n=1 Tax=Cavenderia fasciculata TaxID=261658 RepID=F4QFB0_CACFS|nr:uncharacterized protein DFA_11178 [Cavenderia fasciculata]EGG13417.1 hypothetical protein DFA_11178 [Cavenderia fasciculata]|eukprot:XP_004350121.1 hypothetical protein DFA_11178 [Cavenderia fasciculata]
MSASLRSFFSMPSSTSSSTKIPSSSINVLDHVAGLLCNIEHKLANISMFGNILIVFIKNSGVSIAFPF